jgi:hypothetical protein
MKNIQELLKTYENDSDLLYRVEDYTHDPNLYICDVISEIADSETSIYYKDLFEWLQNDRDSVENIEYALREFGTPTSGNSVPDFMKILQQGQYYGNEQKLYNDLNSIGKIWLLAYLRDKENLSEITDEQAEFVDDLEIDNNDKFDEILSKWREFNTVSE